MTHDQFVGKLRAHQAADEKKKKAPRWAVLPGNEIRAGAFCPVTYVCLKETGRSHDITCWEYAAEGLGLEAPREIVYAADRIPGFDPYMRDRLLDATGIGHNERRRQNVKG